MPVSAKNVTYTTTWAATSPLVYFTSLGTTTDAIIDSGVQGDATLTLSDNGFYYDFQADSFGDCPSTFNPSLTWKKDCYIQFNFIVSDDCYLSMDYSDIASVPGLYVLIGNESFFAPDATTFQVIANGGVVHDGAMTNTHDLVLENVEVSTVFSFCYTLPSSNNKVTISNHGGDAASVCCRMPGQFTLSTSAGGDSGGSSGGDDSGSSGGSSSPSIEGIDVVVGHLEEISGKLTQVIDWQNTFYEDISDSSGSIWSAGKEAIGSLFTPSADDLQQATQGLQDTVKDKLGGAYTAFDTVDNAAEQMKDKLSNPTPKESITFPGISLPAAGNVEAITILPASEVSLPDKLMNVLQPVLGSIVCILVCWYTINTMKNMVVCFTSSMSYAEYLKFSKGDGS